MDYNKSSNFASDTPSKIKSIKDLRTPTLEESRMEYREYIEHVAFLIATSLEVCREFTNTIAGVCSSILMFGIEFDDEKIRQSLDAIKMQAKQCIDQYTPSAESEARKINQERIDDAIELLKKLNFPFKLDTSEKCSIFEEICKSNLNNGNTLMNTYVDYLDIRNNTIRNFQVKYIVPIAYFFMLSRYLESRPIKGLVNYAEECKKNGEYKQIFIKLTETTTKNSSCVKICSKKLPIVSEDVEKRKNSAWGLEKACKIMLAIASKITKDFELEYMRMFGIFAFEVLFAADGEEEFELAISCLDQWLQCLLKKCGKNNLNEFDTEISELMETRISNELKKLTKKAIILKTFDSFTKDLKSLHKSSSSGQLEKENLKKEVYLPGLDLSLHGPPYKFDKSDKKYINGKRLFEQEVIEMGVDVRPFFRDGLHISDDVSRMKAVASQLIIDFYPRFKIFEYRPYFTFEKIRELYENEDCRKFCGCLGIVGCCVYNVGIGAAGSFFGDRITAYYEKVNNITKSERTLVQSNDVDQQISLTEDNHNSSVEGSDSTTY